MHWLEKLQKINPVAVTKIRRRGYNKGANSLKQAFDWLNTQEGRDYWSDLHDEIENYEEEEKPVSKRHKHADLIIAWAEGAEIEYRSLTGKWKFVREPTWSEDYEYRVKPKTVKRYVRVGVCRNENGEYLDLAQGWGPVVLSRQEAHDQFVRWASDLIEVELKGAEK